MPIGTPPFSTPARWWPSGDTSNSTAKRKTTNRASPAGKPIDEAQRAADRKRFVRDNPEEVKDPERAARYGVSKEAAESHEEQAKKAAPTRRNPNIPHRPPDQVMADRAYARNQRRESEGLSTDSRAMIFGRDKPRPRRGR